MSKQKFVGVQFVETVRTGNRTFSFGVYSDHKIGRIPFVGLAEKLSTDKDNPIRGRNLSIARAFLILGKEIEKREWDKLKQDSKPVIKKPLSKQEIEAFKAAGQAVREARAKAKVVKDAKKGSKTSTSSAKKDSKVSKKSAGA